MVVPSKNLPTPLAMVVCRLNKVGTNASAESFLYTSYLAEAAIKLMGLTMAGLKHMDVRGAKAGDQEKKETQKK
ncbi:MAG: hypothetical protein ACLFWL_18005 [Candidatus Brocadiia bacterium]